MRTQEQVSRVCNTLGLDRRRKSILEWKRMEIFNQRQLTEVALDLQKMSDTQCLLILNKQYPFPDNTPLILRETPHSLHF